MCLAALRWHGDRSTNRYIVFQLLPHTLDLGPAVWRVLSKCHEIAASHAYEAPKPLEFKQTGAYWDKIGWRVDIRFHELGLPIKPSQHLDVLNPLLPKRYAPLQASGAGLQSVYLTRAPEELAAALIDLLGAEAHDLVLGYRAAEERPIASAVGLVEWEEHALSVVQGDATLPDTQRQAIVLARRGQGLFKKRVMTIEHACRITGVNREEHLRASHSKPWRDATNEERLDGENGLLLTPSTGAPRTLAVARADYRVPSPCGSP